MKIYTKANGKPKWWESEKTRWNCTAICQEVHTELMDPLGFPSLDYSEKEKCVNSTRNLEPALYRMCTANIQTVRNTSRLNTSPLKIDIKSHIESVNKQGRHTTNDI